MGSFIFSLFYVSTRAILDQAYRLNTEYKIILFQTAFGILSVNLPTILTRRLRFRIPNVFAALYTVFLWCSIFLGEVMLFYYRLPHFDDFLHLISSMMLGLLGFSLIDVLNNDRRHLLLKLSPAYEAFFAVCFAVFVGVLWEIYEFTFDGILGLNMQKFLSPTDRGTEPLIGRAALVDTMTDLIIDCIGSLIVAVFGYISLKRKRGWLELFRISVDSPPQGDHGRKPPSPK